MGMDERVKYPKRKLCMVLKYAKLYFIENKKP